MGVTQLGRLVNGVVRIRCLPSKHGSRAVLAIIVLVLYIIHSSLATALPSSDPVKIKLNVLFILDSSGSMWERQNGIPKFESARKVLSDVIAGLPPDQSLGLITYGHRRRHDCSDLEVLAPIGSKNAAEIKELASKLKPKGMTPLADSLQMGADQFQGIEGAKMIVLITDGGEECGGDPCAVVRGLASSGLVVRVNVVGLIVSKEERKELQCIAKEGGGRYFDVTNKESLLLTIGALDKDIETFSSPAPMSPPPRSELRSNEVNLLLASKGGVIIASPNASWNAIVSGIDGNSISTWPDQEAVFGFKDKQSARFSRFAIAIPATLPQNIKAFELLAAKDSPGGPFFSLGQFSTDNKLGKSLYQEFGFSETIAKYFKFRVISNFGYQVEDLRNTQIFQIRLIGSLM